MEDEECKDCMTKSDIAFAILGVAIGVVFLYIGFDMMFGITTKLTRRPEVSND